MSAFGKLLRKYRQQQGLTLRELGERARMSAVYLIDIEKGRRPAPSRELMKRLVRALGLTDQEQIDGFYDAAARTRTGDWVPEDVRDVLRRLDNMPALMRTIKRNKLQKKDVERLIQIIEKGDLNKG